MLDTEEFMKEMKGCMKTCGSNCHENSRGSTGFENFCNKVSFFETLFVIESKKMRWKRLIILGILLF